MSDLESCYDQQHLLISVVFIKLTCSRPELDSMLENLSSQEVMSYLTQGSSV